MMESSATSTAVRDSGQASVPPGANSSNKDLLIDLEGVTCEPTPARNRTLWNFHCDGATYPAKLVNLPCPVELHKTHDHAAYYKSSEISQMLIVYEDEMALEEAEEKPIEGFPSYYHSGLTPPLRRVVERRFAAREHTAIPPPRSAVADVEMELMDLMENIAKDEKGKRNKVPTLASATKVLEEVVEEVVDYEPWMDDYGRQPQGVEFDSDDQLCSLHPEVWLSPDVIREIVEQDQEARKKKQITLENKKEKRKEKKTLTVALASEPPLPPLPKKGIASKKNTEEVDEVTQAATSMLKGGEIFDDDDYMLDLDLNDGEIDFDGIKIE